MSTVTPDSPPTESRGLSPDDGHEMSLVEHLTELRTRLIRAGIGLLVGMVLSVFFVNRIVGALTRLANQVGADAVQALGVLEGFTTYVKVSFTIGLVFAMPLIVYQLIAFVSPGLTRSERRFVLQALPFIAMLFVSGMAFAYFVVLRTSLAVLLNIGGDFWEVNLRLNEFISFVTNLVIWVGVSFEVPIVVYMLIRLGIVSSERLSGLRRYVFLGIILAAAIITPTPDPLNMMIVAAPMYLLYELGIVLGRGAERRREQG